MDINVPTCEHSYEREILPQLDIDFPAYQKTKWQWLSKQWLTIKLSFRLKFKGRWPWTSMRPLIIRQEDSWHSRHYRCCSKQDSWSLCPTTLGSIPSLQRKPWGEQFKGGGKFIWAQNVRGFYCTATWLSFFNCSEAEYRGREHRVETDSHGMGGKSILPILYPDPGKGMSKGCCWKIQMHTENNEFTLSRKTFVVNP